MPGDDFSTEPKPTRFNNTWAPCNDLEQFRKRRRRGQRTKANEVLFERDAAKGIRAVHRTMLGEDA
jgi:hypothetical protein